jgi:hypothetical protein
MSCALLWHCVRVGPTSDPGIQERTEGSRLRILTSQFKTVSEKLCSTSEVIHDSSG